MLTPDIFYRHSGVRLPAHLMTPIINSLEDFEFPRNALYNSVSFDGVRIAPPSDDYLLRNIKKQILMDHVLNLVDLAGNAKKITTPVQPYIREYHVHNRRFKYNRDMVKVDRDAGTLMITNYDLLQKLYRYPRNRFTEAFKWHNLSKTVWATVGQHAASSSRDNYVFFDLPKILPSVQSLDTYSKLFNSSYLSIFPTPESMAIMEFWKWLGVDTREDSVLNVLTKESLHKVNVVYRDTNKWIMFNLGVLDSWRDVPSDDEHAPVQKIKIKPQDLQKRFLRMLMSLMHTRADAPVEETTNPEATEDDNAGAPPTNPMTGKPAPLVIEQQLTDGVPLNNEETRSEAAARLLETLDDDLHDLLVIENLKAVGPVDEEEDNGNTKVESLVSINDFNKDILPEDAIIKICNRQADDGVITAAVFRNLVNAATSYKSIRAPIGQQTLEEFINIPTEDLVIHESPPIKDIPTVIDKSMLKSSLLAFDEKYVSNVLAKDIAGMVVGVQKAGVILSDYTVESHSEILGDFEIHTMKVRPVEGVSSVLRFRVPVVSEEGTITYNGNKYRLRKQRGDLPIRKTAPNLVALTSYYGRTFIQRSPKKVNDYGQWLCNKIMLKGLDGADLSITNLATGNVFDNEIKAPRVYSLLSQSFVSFTAKGFQFTFDHNSLEKFYGTELVNAQKALGCTIVAMNGEDDALAMDKDGILYEVRPEGNKSIGTFENFVGIDIADAPVDFSELKVMGKNIAVGLVLAYGIGLTELCERLGVEPRKVPAGSRLNLEAHEYAIAFSDVSLVFSRNDKLASMILAGFGEYSKTIRRYPVAAMDKPNVYLNILESAGLSTRFLREIQNMTNLFVDPITKELLVEMKEPTTFAGLLVRSSEMLLLDDHPDQLDMRYMRIKGYERLAGAVYSELVQSIRSHGSRPGKNSKPLELHPYAVWKKIVQDPSMAMISDLNPIQNLKEMEAVTYSGTGGRSTRTMTRSTRQYHNSDEGVISESTVDSSSVGVNIYTSADPQFKSVRGTTKPYDFKKTGATALLSTSALISPGSDHDDPKRVNFIGIQHSHGIACHGYSQASVRTGYEQVIAHRTGDLYAYTARQDGVVTKRSPDGIQVTYKDGSEKAFQIGRRFGAAAGLTIPHDVVSDLKEGDEFKLGDPLVYNKGFFERDILDPTQIIWKAGVTVKTVLYESNETLEDASSISEALSLRLKTRTTKVKTVVVGFDQVVRAMAKQNDVMVPDTPLCVIEDATTSGANLFDEETLNTLQLLSNQAPTAKTHGVLDRVEVFYHGDIEDMSESLQALAHSYNQAATVRARAIGKESVTGSVNSDLRVDGEPLALDTMAIRFYITGDVAAGVGDKGVFANQMKTVFSKVFANKMRTESGETIDAVFGQKSVQDRIVTSVNIIGTTNTLLNVVGKRAVEIFKQGVK